MASLAQRLDEVHRDPGEAPTVEEALLRAAGRSRALGAALSPDEGRLLAALAAEIVRACERGKRTERAGAFAEVGAVAGFVLLALGLAALVGATLGHLVVALPLAELPTRPGVWSGGVLALAGVGLLLLARTRQDRATTPPRS